MKPEPDKLATSPARNPFLSTPDVAPGVECGVDNIGLVQLRRQITPKGRLGRFFSRWLGQRYDRKLHLDKAGSAFWRQIDGRRPLGEIASALVAELALDESAARRATLVFARDLMVRHLIVLAVPMALEKQEVLS